MLVARSEAVWLYSAPAATARTLRQLAPVDRLLELGRKGDWIKVAMFRVVDGRGWVHDADVLAERVMPEPPPPKVVVRETDQIGDEGLGRFVLALEGTPTIGYQASCRILAGAEQEEALEFASWVPDQVAIHAQAISCSVRKRDAFGRLRVSLLVGDTELASSATRVAFNWVRVRSDGPWGPAQAARGSVAVVLPEITGSLRGGRIIIPQMGNPVPPL